MHMAAICPFLCLHDIPVCAFVTTYLSVHWLRITVDCFAVSVLVYFSQAHAQGLSGICARQWDCWVTGWPTLSLTK